MKNLKNLGKALNKAEQKTINGGTFEIPCFWGTSPNPCRGKSTMVPCPNSPGYYTCVNQ